MSESTYLSMQRFNMLRVPDEIQAILLVVKRQSTSEITWQRSCLGALSVAIIALSTARPYSGGLPARRSMRASGVRDFLLMSAGLLRDAQSVTWVFATIITALVAKSLALTL